jgi:hypothetical protein
MKKLLFIFIIFGFYFNCGITISKEAMDKKIFDSFIGLHSEEIVKTLGKTYSYRPLNEESTIYYLTYDRHKINEDKLNDYSQYNNPIYISTSTRNFTIFNFFKQVDFIIKDKYCTDWIAY